MWIVKNMTEPISALERAWHHANALEKGLTKFPASTAAEVANWWEVVINSLEQPHRRH